LGFNHSDKTRAKMSADRKGIRTKNLCFAWNSC
jgi:hypothetical protein